MITVSEISEKLWERVQDVCKELLPNGKRVSNEWEAGSVDGECGKSLKVNLAGKKKWTDFASGEGGDLLDLWVLARGCQLHQAIKEAKSFLGIQDDDRHFKKPKKKFSTPAPKGIKKPSQASTSPAMTYLMSRGLTEETIKRFRISDGSVWHDGRSLDAVAFPYFRDDKLLQVKQIAIERPNGKKQMRVEANCEPCLFGWHTIDAAERTLILTEGEIDAMSLNQMGMPAMSVPFGGGKGAKQQWIDHEWNNLERFESIFICMDTDEAGKEAAHEIANRLGIERCYMIELDCKDPNELLQSCASVEEAEERFLQIADKAKNFDPEELCEAEAYRHDTKELFLNPDAHKGMSTPWKYLNDIFSLRPAEISIFNGVNGHGKSQVVGHLTCHVMSQKEKICVASMELKPEILLKRLTRQATGAKMPTEEVIDTAFDWYQDNLWMFNLVGTAKADRMLEIFKYARMRYGIKFFVIDSLMKCGIDEEDRSGQKAFMEKLCDFKNKYDAHIFLVTHSRKAESEEKPTGKMDVKGSGAITDLVDNVFVIWRNKAKEDADRRISMNQALEDDHEVSLQPGCLLILCKQRNGEGEEGKIKLAFCRNSNQYKNNEAEPPVIYAAGYNEVNRYAEM